ncbi:phosphoribosylformylglycinamidine synthase I [Rubinisphaera italica]|uniref:Phosphoribosylformylglycinamidine synthase n=1 Tax=Rubinisphaera italica TaxID=2527969 RepID=A0A5C5XLW6_9PLAN|nr:phosphoribosylformylglycinamidine synthase I [Rubinisphaera italica]TWT64187.1 Phosphoribosylformylglycinamidine synthase [Rubinisphaera italica]
MSSTPRICVLRAPGTNSDHETCYAFEQAGGKVDNVHVFELTESPERLQDYQILCIPGGFSYGDDIGAGVIFAGQIRRKMGDLLHAHLQRNTLTLGICNGFQVLLKSGILPNGTEDWTPGPEFEREATLTWNNNGKYTARWVKMVVDSPQNVFLKGIETIEMPLAHAEGKLCVANDDLLNSWKANRQIAVRYCDDSHSANDEVLSEEYNPNGSVANIAGLSDVSGRVLGLMPHPERFIKATHHPSWTRRPERGAGDGLKLFQNAVNYFA